MRVIIPAAGMGTRLRPLTDDRPKGLVEICGRPLLWYMLERLSRVGFDEAVVVCGYRAEQLRDTLLECPIRPRLRFVDNDDYATTNSIVSLWLTREFWSEPFCVVDGDVLAASALLDRLVSAPGECLIVDATKSHRDIDMKTEISAGRVRGFAKDLPPERCSGEFFGMARWSPSGARALGRAMERLIADGGSGLWYEDAIHEIVDECAIRPIYSAGGDWAEVDAPQDVPMAKKLAFAEPSRLPRRRY